MKAKPDVPAAGGGSAVRVYLIEDHRLLRESTAGMLGAQGFEVVGTAANGQDALREIGHVEHEVVLLDAGLLDSVALVPQLRRASVNALVIATSFQPSRAGLLAFIRAGVAAFIMKDATEAGVAAAIRRAVVGAPVLPRELGGLLLSHVAAQASGRSRAEAAPDVRLTPREGEVIALITEGLSNKEIADRLHLATHTVKTHVHAVLEKLRLRNRLEIAAFAHSHPRDP